MIRRPRHRPAPRPNPLMTQARNVAKVRYGPEESALAGILSGAQQDLVRGTQIQRDTARGIQAAIKAAKPMVVSAYAGASGSIQKASANVNHDLATLSAAADPYRATMDTEAAASRQRLAEGVAAAQANLANQQTQAQQGRAYGEQSLARTYVDAANKVRDRQLALGQEKGAFIASTFGDLQGAAAKAQSDAQAAAEKRAIDMAQLAQGGRRLNIQSFSARTQRAQSNRRLSQTDRSLNIQDYKAHHPSTGRGRAGSKPKPTRALSPAGRNAAYDQIGSAVAAIRRLRAGGASSGAIRQSLAAGVPANRKAGTPAIPRITPDYINAAYDIVALGGLGAQNRHTLQRRGLDTRRYPSARPRAAVPVWSPAHHFGPQ